jgi:hypothetical protein
MMNEKKFELLLTKELKKSSANTIVSDDDGANYFVFGKYDITQTPDGFLVSDWHSAIHCFSTKRIALSWCVADKFQKYNLSNNIMILDRRQQVLKTDIFCSRKTAEVSGHESFYEIVNTKMQPKIDMLASVTAELEKCINSAKYLQIRGFHNETARTSGS